jgi:hypothetical protein
VPDLICLGEAMVEFNQQPHSANGSEGDDLYKAGFGGDTSSAIS